MSVVVSGFLKHQQVHTSHLKIDSWEMIRLPFRMAFFFQGAIYVSWEIPSYIQVFSQIYPDW